MRFFLSIRAAGSLSVLFFSIISTSYSCWLIYRALTHSHGGQCGCQLGGARPGCTCSETSGSPEKRTWRPDHLSNPPDSASATFSTTLGNENEIWGVCLFPEHAALTAMVWSRIRPPLTFWYSRSFSACSLSFSERSRKKVEKCGRAILSLSKYMPLEGEKMTSKYD